MPVYILSAEAISPQETFLKESFLENPVLPEGEYFTCLHPDYKQFIHPGSLRRMSNVIRMGLASSKVCLQNAGIEKPGAILVGSGLGCVQDTVKFLKQIIENDEQLLNPTAFIQSTHNTVSGQIALMLGCREYNLTFTQKTLSFETALLDAIMLLTENRIGTALVGGIDEIVDESYRLMVQSGCAKGLPEKDILSSSTPGYLAGEGASFFVLSNHTGQSTMARIDDLEIINRFSGDQELKVRLEAFLERNGAGFEDVDLFVTGQNGDDRYRETYEQAAGLFSGSIVSGYKHLVGEYDTASAFGTYLAAKIISRKEVPRAVRMNDVSRKRISRGLVFNFGKDRDFSFTLVSDPQS